MLKADKLDKIRNLKWPIGIALLFIIFVLILLVAIPCLSYYKINESEKLGIGLNDSIIQLGNFIILSMTLIALIVYTFFTYYLAIKKDDARQCNEFSVI